MTTRTTTVPPITTGYDVDLEIAEILKLKAEVAALEEAEKASKDKLIAEMLKARQYEVDFPNGLKARLYEASVGESYYRPSYVMNRLNLEENGQMVNLIPFNQITNLIVIHSEGVNGLVKRGHISEDDSTKAFVQGYAVREEHLKFF